MSTEGDPAPWRALMRGEWARRDLAILAVAMREKGFTEWAKYIDEAVERLREERRALESIAASRVALKLEPELEPEFQGIDYPVKKP